ncbi:CYTH domain-containing protein [Aureispira anguillae]|uniref:CYTH domain-containing protein n=1 Tax=Aureispira anguillae TaxID=2864201 RepID=A0A915YCP1_9BACT|nr:CYTH domain-containing protein [Aureispira anguillae]BDS10639.1 CYTH domain-containing protein [Aureispira anguillae]
MGIEIERKYLVNPTLWQLTKPLAVATPIRQGYLSLNPERTVRIRIKNNNAYLTIKGKNEGIKRIEFEYPIPLEEGLDLLPLCEGAIIEKTRYTIAIEGLTWEIDEFEGENLGLIVAEVELQAEHESIRLPVWIKQEVSLDPRYYNANLVQCPFKNWK